MSKSIISLLIIIATPFVFHNGYKLYAEYREIEEFSYKALLNYVEREPINEQLISMVDQALNDGTISGKEFKGLFNYIMEQDGMFTGATVGVDHSGSKIDLVNYLGSLKNRT